MKSRIFIFILCGMAFSQSQAFDFFGLFSSDPAKEEAAAAEATIPDEEKVSTLDEDTPMVQTDVAGGKTLTGPRAFRAPDYSGQSQALGYGPEAFAIPKGLERTVGFWIDIYSKYTTEQGLIHDTENLDNIYTHIDFKDIVNDESLNRFQKERRKQKLVEEKKREVVEMLLKLDKVQSAEGLNEAEKKIWDMFQGNTEPHKFREAAQKSRIRFQLGQKDRMQAAIFFSGRYLEEMEKIFREAGLPIELTRLVFVESSFNVLARSKVGASGLWQIMRYTARPYHMINDAVDQRNHPLAATKLASRLMKDNFNLLKAWPLAMTGYNHGPTGVRKLTEKYQTRDLPELIRAKSGRSFGFASRNFYACFLAVLEVEKNALKYFPKIVWSQPLDAEEIKLPMPVKYKELMTWFDGNAEKAEVFNPHLSRQTRRGTLSIPAKTLISIPKDRYNLALISLARGEFRYSTNMGPEIRAPEEIKTPEIKPAEPDK
ncbi:MAG: lytic transglycosylase domain-containing protein [Pseudobdellovibrionaceae bacterium]